MAIDVSAASYESGRKALQLAADGGSSSVQQIAPLLVHEAGDYRTSSCLDPVWYQEFPAITCNHHTALEVAASEGHVDAVERLLEAGADPNAPVHKGGISVLEAAAAQGQIIVVQMLLERGAHPDHHGELSGTTPLIAAVMAGHVEICEALVQRGADVSSLALYGSNREYSAIEAAGETLSITLSKLFLRVVEDTAKEFDPEELEVAIAEGRLEDTWRLLRTEKFLGSARGGIDRALTVVAAAGNMPILQRLLDAGADVTSTQHRSAELIAAAASSGNVEAMNKLLQIASDRITLHKDFVTRALQSAVSAGETAPIEPLIQSGASATRIDIRRAAAEGHLDALASILQSGARVEETPFNNKYFSTVLGRFTALQLAAQHGHQAVVDLLLAQGADVNKFVDVCAEYGKDGAGASALQLAVTSGHLTVAKLLINAGADLNASCKNNDTPLQAAIRTGDTVAIELLLVAGADVDVVVDDEADVEVRMYHQDWYHQDSDWFDRSRGKTALSVAAEVGNLDLVVRLLSMMSPDCALQTVPWALQKATENQHADIVRQLLQMHPDVNKRRGEVHESTSLETAAANGNFEILELLLSEGADANLNPSAGWKPTALQSSSERGDLAAVRLLLAAGAEVNVTGSTAPPLLLAIRGGHVQVFEHLLAAGADIHAVAYRGQTMLEAAEAGGGADMLDRVRAALRIRPPPARIEQSIGRGTGPLCETCRLAPLLELFRFERRRVVLHPSLPALRASAAAGCPFCCFLWKRLGITIISIPQPSPVNLLRNYGNTVSCHLTEPFPGPPKSREQLQEEFLFSPTFDGSRARAPITENTSSRETYKQIHAWLRTCQNEHPRCRAPVGNPYLPTRLIYLDSSKDSALRNPVDTSLQPRLVSANDLDRSECRYIALSYRWPEDFHVEAKSNRDNVRQQMRGLNTSKLPQIFNDVFQVALGMGISYVWIDSLCIVQDDPEDWNREAALMVQVYRHAEFTVAAAVPPAKPDLGLFRHPDPSDILSVALFGLQGPENNDMGQDVVVMKAQEEAYKGSPLVSRGWCFQERETSRRVVHYTETQVLWECRTIQASEGLPYGDSTLWPTRMLDNELNEEAVLEAWHKAVEDYSERELTVFTDKFPALSGLAAAIREYKPANCRYLAGLWEDNFLSDMQWSSRNQNDRAIKNRRYPEYVAPTWSWASVAGPVSYNAAPNERHSTEHYAGDAEYVLKVLDISVQTSANDPFGAVRQAILTCTAGLLPGLLKTSHKDSHDYEVRTRDGLSMGDLDFDVDPKIYDGANIEVLFCIDLGGPEEYGQGPGLVVLPTGDRENEYKRVGIIPQMARRLEFYRTEIKRITII